MKYKDLFIDLDETLLDFNASELDSIKKTYRHYGIEDSDVNINLFTAINASLWDQHNHGTYEKSKIRLARFQYTLEVLQRNDIEPEAACNTYVEALASCNHIIDGVWDTLVNLKHQGYRLFVITNGFTYIQTNRLSNSKLDTIVDGVFISEQMGINKPDNAYMEYVAHHIDNYDPSTSLIIGDSIASDINLGINCGIDTCWINPKHKENTKATYSIDSFNSILSIL